MAEAGEGGGETCICVRPHVDTTPTTRSWVIGSHSLAGRLQWWAPTREADRQRVKENIIDNRQTLPFYFDSRPRANRFRVPVPVGPLPK